MLKIAIVEDEWQCAEDLQNCLRTYSEQYGTEFNISCYKKGSEFLFNYTNDLDIVFMDVDMPEMNGFVTAKKLRELDRDVILIFVTFLSKYAYKGYEVDALDYVIKPVNYEMLRMKIQKAISRCEQRAQTELLLPTRDGTLRMKASDLLYVEINGHDIVYHTSTGEHPCYGTLKAVEKLLPVGQFCRCNNGYLVNLKCVTRIEGDFVQVGSQKLPMSRPRKKEFIEALHNYLLGGPK